jgi:hypothetical protein
MIESLVSSRRKALQKGSRPRHGDPFALNYLLSWLPGCLIESFFGIRLNQSEQKEVTGYNVVRILALRWPLCQPQGLLA